MSSGKLYKFHINESIEETFESEVDISKLIIPFSWLFKKYHDITIAVLAGFMLGSLNKIWPWKETIESIIVDGEMKPLIEKNILPQLNNTDHHFLLAILFMLGYG